MKRHTIVLGITILLALGAFAVALVLLGTSPKTAKGNIEAYLNASEASSDSPPVSIQLPICVGPSEEFDFVVSVSGTGTQSITVKHGGLAWGGLTYPYAQDVPLTWLDCRNGFCTLDYFGEVTGTARLTTTANASSWFVGTTEFVWVSVGGGEPTPASLTVGNCPTATNTPVPTATPNIWLTPTATPALTIRLWLPHTLR